MKSENKDGASACTNLKTAPATSRISTSPGIEPRTLKKCRRARAFAVTMIFVSVNFATFLIQKETAEYQAIQLILNTHEFVSGGIREKAYDEQLYKRMQCSVIIRDWDDFSGFITEFRNARKDSRDNAKTFYQDFEWLAQRWKDNPLRPSNK